MRTFIRLIIVLLILAVIFGGLFGWKEYQRRQAAQSQGPRPPVVVSSGEATADEWQEGVNSTGSLSAVNGTFVSGEVAGLVSEITFTSGGTVEEGEVLLRLDDSVDQAVLRGLIAEEELARVQFERSANLLPRRAVSQSRFDEDKARYEAAQARVAEQRARIAKKTLRAPFAGRLGIREVDVGDYLSPGARIVELRTLDPIHVDYTVPERRLPFLFEGQAVEVRVDAYPKQTFTGEITAIDTGVNVQTRTVNVRATLDNPETRLRPGMFAEVSTLAPEPRPVVTVPRTAISYNTYGDFLYVIESGEGGNLVVQRRNVETGSVRDGRVEVVKGVEAGERVVSAGVVKLRDGQPVSIDNSVKLDGAPGP